MLLITGLYILTSWGFPLFVLLKNSHGGHSMPNRLLVEEKAVPSPPASGLARRHLATLYLKSNPIRHDAYVD